MDKDTDKKKSNGESKKDLPLTRQNDRDEGSGISAKGPNVSQLGARFQKGQKPTKDPLKAAAEESCWKNLMITLTPMQQRKVKDAPPKYRPLYKRAILGMTSKRAAIKAFCQQCMGYAELPASVRDCSDRVCPLYAFRPYQDKRG